jgi:hypothetical protein
LLTTNTAVCNIRPQVRKDLKMMTIGPKTTRSIYRPSNQLVALWRQSTVDTLMTSRVGC